MKEEFQQMQAFMDERLAARPRGFDLFSRELLANFVRAFDADAKTVYVSGYAFPMELLWAFDVVPFDFEIACNNLPAASSGQGSTIMEIAERAGYARNVCSFDRLIIGCQLRGELPRGSLYLTSSYYCHGKAKANEAVAALAGCESVLFDVPNEVGAAARAYVVAQLQDIARRLEAVTGRPLDMDRLKECLRSSNRARASLLAINALMREKPCPWDGARACLLALAGALFWGSGVCERYHELLRGELEERVRTGKALPERHRVLWFPWVPVQQTNIFTILKEKQVSVPMAEVAEVWWPELDADHPFAALADKALENYLVGPARKRVAAIMRMAEAYGVDGLIHFATPACHQENGAFKLVADACAARGLPILNLDGDMTDERNYSAARTAEALGSFLAILQEQRAP
jgi:benzoyl-CoA reductase/2-hydroxyglutaryl-CoA dehydratase subunit BcrC/BadD/HgdB